MKTYTRHCCKTFFFILFAFFGLSNSLSAAVRYYDIEIIIFESQDQTARNSEQWRKPHDLIIPEKFVILGAPYPGAMPRQFNSRHTFKILPASSFQLTQQAKLLSEKGQNNILLHTAWRQPGMPAESALPIRFQYTFNNTPQSNPAPAAKANASDPAVMTTPASVSNQQQLDGFVKIVLSRYLHANVDLQYTRQIPVTMPAEQTKTSAVTTEEEGEQQPPVVAKTTMQPVTFTFQQSRKMRSKEIHYLDHPVLGILILATPYAGNSLNPN